MERYRHEHTTLAQQPQRRYRYKIVRTDTGINVSYHTTYRHAADTLDEYRGIDRRDGAYVRGRYIIRPVTLRFLKKQQAWIEHAKAVNP